MARRGKPRCPTLHLFSYAHRESLRWPRARCPLKMVRYLGGTTLLDLLGRKFAFLAKSSYFTSAWIEVPGRVSEDDTAHRLLAQCAPVRRAKRGFCSTLRDTDAEFVVWLNPCLPFVKVGTVLEAVTAFMSAWPKAKGLETVARDQNWYWDAETHASTTIKDAEHVRLQEARPQFKSTHMLHIYPRKRKLETGGYWGLAGPMDPMLYEVPMSRECLDVDSPLDFDIVDGLMELAGNR